MTHIYALVSGQLILYVGKTLRTLKLREAQHKLKSNATHSKYIPEYIDWTIKLLETVPENQGTVKEQFYYDTLKPLYNRNRPGQTKKEVQKKYEQSEAYKKLRREKSKTYQQTEAYKQYIKEYRQSEVYKKSQREASRKYYLKKKSEASVDV